MFYKKIAIKNNKWKKNLKLIKILNLILYILSKIKCKIINLILTVLLNWSKRYWI